MIFSFIKYIIKNYESYAFRDLIDKKIFAEILYKNGMSIDKNDDFLIANPDGFRTFFEKINDPLSVILLNLKEKKSLDFVKLKNCISLDFSEDFLDALFKAENNLFLGCENSIKIDNSNEKSVKCFDLNDLVEFEKLLGKNIRSESIVYISLMYEKISIDIFQKMCFLLVASGELDFYSFVYWFLVDKIDIKQKADLDVIARCSFPIFVSKNSPEKWQNIYEILKIDTSLSTAFSLCHHSSKLTVRTNPIHSIESHSTNLKQLKVALCLSGQLRSYKDSFSITSKAFEKINIKPDIFVFTWDGDSEVNKSNDLSRWLPSKYLSIAPSIFKEHKKFKSSLEDIYRFIFERSDVDIDDMRNIYNCISYEVGCEAKFDTNYSLYTEMKVHSSLNQAKMYYGINKSINLAINYARLNEFEYDLIIRSRHDLPIRVISEKDLLLAKDSHKLLTNSFMHNALGDRLFFGPSSIMCEVARLWDLLDQHRGLSFLPYSTQRYAEWLLMEYCLFRGLSADVYKRTEFGNFIPKSMDLHSLVAKLKLHLLTNNNLNDLDKTQIANFIDKFESCKE